MLAEDYCKNEDSLADSVIYCLSRKTIHNKVYVYKQWTEDGETKQKAVPASEVDEVVAKYNEKKMLKAQKKEMDAQIAAMTPAQRRQFREEVRLYRKIQKLDKQCETSQMPNGDARDSADELAISLVMDMLKVVYQYDCPIPTRNTMRYADFVVKGKVWEHMGMKGVHEYDRRQEQKLAEYHDIGLIEGVNLIITQRYRNPQTDQSYLKLPQILWHMVKNGLVDAHTVRRVFRL